MSNSSQNLSFRKEETQCQAQALCIHTYDHKPQCRSELQLGLAPLISVCGGRNGTMIKLQLKKI